MNRLTFGTKLHAIVMALCACALAGPARGAELPSAPSADEAAIRENVRQLEAGWNAKSGAAFAAPFADDADYVIINGIHIRGRSDIAAGHQRIFDSIYKVSTLSLSVTRLRLLRPDVAVAHVGGVLRVPQGGQTQEHAVTITLVMVRDAGAWKIAAFQNTAVAERGR